MRKHNDDVEADLVGAFHEPLRTMNLALRYSAGSMLPVSRRMSQTAAHLVEYVIPHVPVRQWVVSLPIPLRLLLAAQPTGSALSPRAARPAACRRFDAEGR